MNISDYPDLYHFYHVFADGEWEEAADEHFTALKEHGLYENLKGFYLGVVGKDENREAVKKKTLDYGFNAYIRAEAPLAWEQLTLEALRRHCTVNDGNILYAHTKSAFNHVDINIGWRSSMCYYNVVKWREAIQHLEDVDTVGCHWVNDAMWGGNYWWATARHIRTLKPLEYQDRWRAELWIGQREDIPGLEKVKIYDMNPGWPDPKLFTTSW